MQRTVRASPTGRRPILESLGFPYPPDFWRVVRISALFWVLSRLVIASILALSGGTSAALQLSWSARALLVVLTAILVWWDRRRAHELLLHANLGAAEGWFWAGSAATAAVLDVATQVLYRML